MFAALTDNAVIINAPYELVWRVTNDLPGWPELFSEYAAVEILERDEHTVRFRLTMHPDARGDIWSWVSERTADPVAGTVRARRLETGWFEYMKIRWDFEQVRDGILMRWRQEFAMKPNSPVNLETMRGRITAGTIMQMGRIKASIEHSTGRNAPFGESQSPEPAVSVT